MPAPASRRSYILTMYSATFNGQNFVVNNLYINQPNGNYVGLFGAVGSGGTVKNIGLTNVNVTGSFDVGRLAGENELGTVTGAYVTGAVNGGSGGEQVGGLVGGNVDGTINTSYATATVQGNLYVGGLVGMNQGSSTQGQISQSYATAVVSGIGSNSQDIGGLVGYQQSGTISTSYAAGAVTGANDVGGLVGENLSTTTNSVYQSYATGAVAATGLTYSTAGGLIGYNSGPVSQVYATGAVNGYNDGAFGGRIGQNAGALTNVYVTGSVTATYVGGGGNGTSSVGGLTLESSLDHQCVRDRDGDRRSIGARRFQRRRVYRHQERRHDQGGLLGIFDQYIDHGRRRRRRLHKRHHPRSHLDAAIPGHRNRRIWIYHQFQLLLLGHRNQPVVPVFYMAVCHSAAGCLRHRLRKFGHHPACRRHRHRTGERQRRPDQFDWLQRRLLFPAPPARSRRPAARCSPIQAGQMPASPISKTQPDRSPASTSMAPISPNTPRSPPIPRWCRACPGDRRQCHRANAGERAQQSGDHPTASSFGIDQAISTGTLVLDTTGTVTQSAAITAATGLDLLVAALPRAHQCGQ